jgi:CHAD domain-containing protein
MAFYFKKKETVPKAIRCLGRERIENALECLKDCGRPEAIHCARKDIKKSRAVIRLVRTEIPKKAYSRQIRLLREAAKHLAGPRDAFIKVNTLRNLMRHFKGQLAPGALRHVRAALHSALNEETRRFAKEKTAKTVERLLRRAAKEFDDLTVNGKGWKALSPGVKTAYSKGRCAYQTVLKDPAPENFHEWRKRAKDLWYQVSLLRPVWPEQMDAMASELETLGEYLGDDHDLVVLQEAVEGRCAGKGNARELETLIQSIEKRQRELRAASHGSDDGSDNDKLRELETLIGLMEERQRELRAAALELGARFYAEKPSAFCNRLAGYWQTWQCEKKPILQSAKATS